MASSAPINYASWGRRAAALLIDNLILAAVVVGTLVPAFAIDYAPVSAPLGIFGIAVWVLGPFIYFPLLHARSGQTLGKRLLGIRVQHSERGGPIRFLAAFSRFGLTYLFSLAAVPALVDYLSPLWNARNQAWHDKFAKSVVVRL